MSGRAGTGSGAGGKGAAAAASAALVLAVLSPVHQSWRRRPRDGFPLSYYPMFSARRKETGTVTHLVGRTAEGEERTLPHHLIGPGGLNHVRRQLARAARHGGAEAIGVRVAARVAASGRSSLADVDEVRVVTREYGFHDFFRGNRTPVTEQLHACVRVPR